MKKIAIDFCWILLALEKVYKIVKNNLWDVLQYAYIIISLLYFSILICEALTAVCAEMIAKVVI